MPNNEESSIDQNGLKLMQAVAQAWLAQKGSTQPRSEFESERNRYDFKQKPTRFKLEAMKKMAAKEPVSTSSLDLSTSLFDYYEIVTLTKKLEDNLMLEQYSLDAIIWKERKGEGKNSLRNLFSRNSNLKRFGVVNTGREDER